MGRGVGSDFFTPPHGVGTPSLAPHGVGAPWVPHRPTPPRRSLIFVIDLIITTSVYPTLVYLDLTITAPAYPALVYLDSLKVLSP